jgi:hypothetical protein
MIENIRLSFKNILINIKIHESLVSLVFLTGNEIIYHCEHDLMKTRSYSIK